MKILIVTSYFPPKRGIASLRPYSFAKYWAELGHDVTVLTTKKYTSEVGLDLDCSGFSVIETPLPFWHRWLVEKKQVNSSMFERGIVTKGRKTRWRGAVLIDRLSRYRQTTGVLKDQRMPSHLDPWYISAMSAIEGRNWDLVVSTYSPYVAHLIAYRIVKKKMANLWIADYRDLWTGSHLFSGIWPITKLELALEKKVNETADCVTTVSEPLGDYLRDNFKCKKVGVVENGFDPEDLLIENAASYLDSSRLTLAYTGTVYPGLQDVAPLFSAIASIKESESRGLLDGFEVLVAGKSGDYFLSTAEEYGVAEFVKCVGMVPRADALRIQRDAHVLIFLGAVNSSVKGILTGKLFEYLNSGTRIWALGESETSEAGKLIIKARCGQVFGSDSVSLRNELIKILIIRNKPSILPDRVFLDRFSRRSLAQKMLNFLG